MWGSSTGWLVFYAALGLGACSRGVELLEPLHTVARAQALEHASVLRGRAHLECGDCLRSDASRAAAVVLASQCWDDELCARVAVKLAAELPVGAAVVDYRREALAARQEFALVHVMHHMVVALPRSTWSKQSREHVVRRRGAHRNPN